jgi:hypothetical protein
MEHYTTEEGSKADERGKGVAIKMVTAISAQPTENRIILKPAS